MKQNTYSVYSSEFRDSLKDNLSHKPSFFKNPINEKPASQLISGYTSARNQKSQLKLNNYYEKSNKITNLMSPMLSPKGSYDSVTNYHSLQRGLIPTSKSQYGNQNNNNTSSVSNNININTENLLRNAAEKKINGHKNSHMSSNTVSNNSNLVATKHCNDIKQIKHLMQITPKETNNISRNNSYKKSLGNSSSVMSNSGTPNTLLQQKPLAHNESLSFKRSGGTGSNTSNHIIENSLNIENNLLEFSPTKALNTKNELSASKVINSRISNEEKLKKHQSFSPIGRLSYENRNDSRKNLIEKTKNDNFILKMVSKTNKAPIINHFDGNSQLDSRDTISNEINSKKTSSALSYAKNYAATINVRPHISREETLSPSMNTANFSISKEKDKLAFFATILNKERVRDKIKIESEQDSAYHNDYESFEENSMNKEKNHQNSNSNFDNNRYKSLKTSDAYQYFGNTKSAHKEKEEIALNSKYKENCKQYYRKNGLPTESVQKDNLLNSASGSYKNISNFSLYTSPKDVKTSGRFDTTQSQQHNPNTISLDLEFHHTLQSPKSFALNRDKDTRYSLATLESFAAEKNRQKSQIKDIQERSQKINLKIEEKNDFDASSENYGIIERKSGKVDTIDEIPSIKNSHKNNEKKYPETTKNKNAKKFDIVTTFGEHKRSKDHELGIHNSGVTSTSASSLSIRELKHPFKAESLKENESQPIIKRSTTVGEDEKIYPSSSLVRTNTSPQEKKETIKSDALNSNEANLRKIPIDLNFQHKSAEASASNNEQSKPLKYGNDVMGFEMKKMFDKMRFLVENYKVKEIKWFEEKMALISRIAILENKLSRYEKDMY